MTLEELRPMLSRLEFPAADSRDYSTMGGFVATIAGRAVKEGETFDQQGFRFEVLDMDETHIDKVLITPLDSRSPLLNAKGSQISASGSASGDSTPSSDSPR